MGSGEWEVVGAPYPASYTIERELGGGGMSRVFVAEDTALAGQRELAVEEYARVADYWRNADAPQLRVARDEARTALQRLDADGRLRGELRRP